MSSKDTSLDQPKDKSPEDDTSESEEPSNDRPIADTSAGEPYRGFPGEEIMFDGSNSYDPNEEGWIKSWHWDFGDGTNSSGEIVTHVYSNLGTYTVVLRVVDNNDDEVQ